MVLQGVSGLLQSLVPPMSSPKGETKRLVNARAPQLFPTVRRAATASPSRHQVSHAGLRPATFGREELSGLIVCLRKTFAAPRGESGCQGDGAGPAFEP